MTPDQAGNKPQRGRGIRLHGHALKPGPRGRTQKLRPILMPDALSGAIDRAVDAGLADSRSHLVRDAVRMWLDSRSMSVSEPAAP